MAAAVGRTQLIRDLTERILCVCRLRGGLVVCQPIPALVLYDSLIVCGHGKVIRQLSIQKRFYNIIGINITVFGQESRFSVKMSHFVYFS